MASLRRPAQTRIRVHPESAGLLVNRTVNAERDQIWRQQPKAGKGLSHHCPWGDDKRNEQGHVQTEGTEERSLKLELDLRDWSYLSGRSLEAFGR